jgi:uncharacterized protein (TIGR02594 family)
MKEVLLEMLSHYGMKEVDGTASNPDILAMFKELGYDWVNDDSTTAWCSAALNYYCKKCGYEYTGKLDARSWLKLPVMILKPSVGDVVVLWRDTPDSWKGHVGLFLSMDETKVFILGGNTNNSLSIAAYPRDRILGFRQAKKLQP